MSRKLSRNELIATPILIVILLIGSIIGQVHYGLTNSQIVRIVLPLSFLSLAIERFLKRNKKNDEKLSLKRKRKKKRFNAPLSDFIQRLRFAIWKILFPFDLNSNYCPPCDIGSLLDYKSSNQEKYRQHFS